MMHKMTNPVRPNARTQVISFNLDPELLGIDLKYVNKVIEIEDFYFVPRAPSFIRGAINNQGKVIAVVDLKNFFNNQITEMTAETKLLIIDSEVYHLGILIDRIKRIESVPLSGPLVSIPEPGETSQYINRMINLGGRILNLVDMEKLMIEIENYFA
jgi:purine-binding chemotaxis protein CheW